MSLPTATETPQIAFPIKNNAGVFTNDPFDLKEGHIGIKQVSAGSEFWYRPIADGATPVPDPIQLGNPGFQLNLSGLQSNDELVYDIVAGEWKNVNKRKVYVPYTGVDLTDGAALISQYAYAKTLSSSDKIDLIVPSGVFDLGSSNLTLDDPNVFIKSTKAAQNKSATPSFAWTDVDLAGATITSTNATSTIIVSSNCRMENTNIENTGSGVGISATTVAADALFIGCTIDTTNTDTGSPNVDFVYENCHVEDQLRHQGNVVFSNGSYLGRPLSGQGNFYFNNSLVNFSIVDTYDAVVNMYNCKIKTNSAYVDALVNDNTIRDCTMDCPSFNFRGYSEVINTKITVSTAGNTYGKLMQGCQIISTATSGTYTFGPNDNDSKLLNTIVESGSETYSVGSGSSKTVVINGCLLSKNVDTTKVSYEGHNLVNGDEYDNRAAGSETITTSTDGSDTLLSTSKRKQLLSGSGVNHVVNVGNATTYNISDDYQFVNSSDEIVKIKNGDAGLFESIFPKTSIVTELISQADSDGEWYPFRYKIPEELYSVVFNDFVKQYSSNSSEMRSFGGNGGAATINTNTSSANTQGIVILNTGSSSINGYAVTANDYAPIRIGDGPVQIRFNARPLSLATGSAGYRLVFGLGNTTDATAFTDGIYFTYDRLVKGTDLWYGRSISSVGGTSTDVTGPTVSTSPDFLNRGMIEINSDASRVDFWINETHVGSITTASSIPSTITSMFLVGSNIGDVGISTRATYVDYMASVKPMGVRR